MGVAVSISAGSPEEETVNRRVTLALSCLAGLLGGALSVPAQEPAPATETMIVVRSSEAPFLNEIKPSAHPVEVGYGGDLVHLLRPLPAMKDRWRSELDPGGPSIEREGPMAELRRAPGDAILFAFASDLGDPVEVPSASWICRRVASEPSLPDEARRTRCASMLRRVLLPGGDLVAFEACASGPCPVALWRGGKLVTTSVDGIVSGRVVPGGAGGVLLLTTRWVRAEGSWTGGTLVPLALSGASPRRLRDIPLDEVDARKADTVTARQVSVEVTSTAPDRSVVRVLGRRRRVSRQDGREIWAKPVEERHSIP
jgi:hypothetical protein